VILVNVGIDSPHLHKSWVIGFFSTALVERAPETSASSDRARRLLLLEQAPILTDWAVVLFAKELLTRNPCILNVMVRFQLI
jgi:hypothetical protein